MQTMKSEHLSARGTDDAKLLVKTYKETQSDRLVMGAYCRSRLRQRIFGGVTEFMLHRENIPILILHT